MTTHRKDIEELRSYYQQLAWYQRWFFPSKLAAILNDSNANPYEVCNTFRQTVSFWYYPFFWSLWRFANTKLFSTYKTTNAAINNIDNHPYQKESKQKLIQLLNQLSQTPLLHNEKSHINIDYIMNHRTKFNQTFLFDIFIKTPNLVDFFNSNYSQELFDFIVEHAQLENVLQALVTIHQIGITINQDLLAFFKGKQNFLFYSEICSILIEINQKMSEINSHEQKAQLLSSLLNYDAHQDHLNLNLNHLKNSILILNKNNLLSLPYFERILTHANIKSLRTLLTFFDSKNIESNLLNRDQAQLTCDLLLRHTTLLSSLLLPNLTKEHFLRHWHPMITDILQRTDLTPEQLHQTLRNYVFNDILQMNLNQPNNAPMAINRNQSTHTASVHATTDVTAWLLLEKHKKETTLPINLAGLWLVIESKLFKIKTQIEQTIKILSSKSNLRKKQENQLLSAQTNLADVANTEAKMQTAKNCLNRLNDVACDIILSAKTKNTALQYINESNLKDDLAIQALLPGLMTQQNQESKLSLQQFIVWIYEEVETNSSKPDYILAFIQALYEIERGYNLDEQGRDDSLESHSICYGGTANKFPQCLVGLSSLIRFSFINEQTIHLYIQQQLINQLPVFCQNLLQQAQQGDLEAKTKFCAFIDQIMSSDKISDVYETFFSATDLTEQIKAEFKLYAILYSEQKLDEQLASFKENSLPYIPEIQPLKPANSFYSVNFLKGFEKYLQAKKEFEQNQSPSKSPATILADIGLMQSPKGDLSRDEKDLNCNATTQSSFI